jgi:ssDNA thymidine ADP-ribosyltransferase, DarT
LDRSECKDLRFISDATNLASILERGVLSFSSAEAVAHKSIAKLEVQTRRAAVQVPNGLPLHDYANLYFNARNPMMYTFHERHEELVLLCVSPEVLDLPGVVLSDMNAARGVARFGPPSEIFPILDRERIFAEWWVHDDLVDQDRHKGEMCAEVLVPTAVPPEYVRGLVVSSEAVRHRVSHDCGRLPVIVDGYQFFRGR